MHFNRKELGVKYAQFVARVILLALLVFFVALVLGFNESKPSVLPFALSLTLIGFIELSTSLLFDKMRAVLVKLQERLGRETGGMAAILLVWLALSVPPAVVLLVVYFVSPTAVPLAFGPFQACLVALFVVLFKAIFSVWTGTPFRLIRFVFKPNSK